MPARSRVASLPSERPNMELTRGSWKQAYERAKGALKRVKVEGERVGGTILMAGEVVGTSWAMSYANQRWGKGEFKVLGMPADLLSGGLLFGFSLFDVMGKYDEHATAVAAGLLSSWSCRTGATMGTEAAQKDAAGPGYLSADQRAAMGAGTGWVDANAQRGPGWVSADANRRAA